MTDLVGIEDGSGMTEWSQLKKLCADNGAKLSLRIETFEDDFRFSLAALNPLNGEPFHDIRTEAGDHAPQYVITQLVNQALAEWWQ